MTGTIIFNDDDNILSADMTAIMTFIQTTLSGGYTVKFMETSNNGLTILKLA